MIAIYICPCFFLGVNDVTVKCNRQVLYKFNIIISVHFLSVLLFHSSWFANVMQVIRNFLYHHDNFRTRRQERIQDVPLVAVQLWIRGRSDKQEREQGVGEMMRARRRRRRMKEGNLWVGGKRCSGGWDCKKTRERRETSQQEEGEEAADAEEKRITRSRGSRRKINRQKREMQQQKNVA